MEIRWVNLSMEVIEWIWYALVTSWNCNLQMININVRSSMGHFTFWISVSLKPKTETKRLIFRLSPEFRLTGAHHCSLHNVIADVVPDTSVFPYLFMNKRKNEVIFVYQNLISNRLTYLVHAKSTGKLISFGFSDRSVRSLVSAKHSENRWV